VEQHEPADASRQLLFSTGLLAAKVNEPEKK
jgi:hypothetical protein